MTRSEEEEDRAPTNGVIVTLVGAVGNHLDRAVGAVASTMQVSVLLA